MMSINERVDIFWTFSAGEVRRINSCGYNVTPLKIPLTKASFSIHLSLSIRIFFMRVIVSNELFSTLVSVRDTVVKYNYPMKFPESNTPKLLVISTLQAFTFYAA